MATPFLVQETQNVLQTAGGTTIGISPLDNVLTLLQNFGFFKVVLPFLLIFALFYAVLLKTGVLGKEADSWTKSTAVIISMAAAFLVIAYTPVVDALMTLLPQASFLLVIALLVMMLFTFLGFKPDIFGTPKNWMWVIILPLILIFIAIVGYSAGPGIPWLYGLSQGLAGGIALDAETINLLVGLLIVLGIPLIVVFAVVYAGKRDTT